MVAGEALENSNEDGFVLLKVMWTSIRGGYS